MNPLVQELLNFLNNSPTPFHAVMQMTSELLSSDYIELQECDSWHLLPHKKYFVKRSGSIIAFATGDFIPVDHGFRLIGAHTDSPCLKLKPNPLMFEHGFTRSSVEIYGSAILSTWFDRDLSLAGMIQVLSKKDTPESQLINLTSPVALMPNLAIHLNRTVNENRTINPHEELIPIWQMCREAILLEKLLGQTRPILAHDLYFYDTQLASLLGGQQEFICSARIDNLVSCFIGLKALLSQSSTHTCFLVCHDHEEVGSRSYNGAQSSFLHDLLTRVCHNNSEDLYRTLARSLFVSADNAHALHPNYPAKHDTNHKPQINHGVVIKINANQSYATFSETAAIFKTICQKHNIPTQLFAVRSDMPCGSTIGPITSSRIGVKTIDIGIPTLAMHSIRETAGVADISWFFQALHAFYHYQEKLF